MAIAPLPTWSWIVVALTLLLLLAMGVVAWRRRQLARASEVDQETGSRALVAMVSRLEIEREYTKSKARYETRMREVTERLATLIARRWERAAPQDVLRAALPQETDGLRAVVAADPGTSFDALIEDVRKAGSNATASVVRRLKGQDPHVPYAEVLVDVARKMHVKDLAPDASPAMVEQATIVAAFRTTLDQVTPEQRDALVARLSAGDRKALQGIGGTGAVLVAANLSGFGLYIGASTVLGTLTSAAGVALPFAAYTGMSSVIATVIGPVGWAAMLGWAAWKIGGVDYKRTVPAVMAIAAVRSRLIAERDQEIDSLELERTGSLATAAGRLTALHAVLERMRGAGLQAVPRASVPL